VLIWDLDKTYLQTHYDSLRDLVRTALEKAADKRAYPGAAILLRALRRTPRGTVRPTYFVSASPPQLRDVITAKFVIDGVEVDGIYFKDNLKNLRPGRTERLREQIGYKLLALVDLRRRLPEGAVEVMFGDDAESDPRAYTLYSAIIERRLAGKPLIEELIHRGVFADEAVRIAWRARQIPARRSIERVFIQVHRTLDLSTLRQVSERIVPTRNYFQTALALHSEGRLGVETVAAVGDELLTEGGFDLFQLGESFRDLVERAIVPAASVRRLATHLVGLQVLPESVMR
jgi:hypothetical protein